jgi:hypothetical protein
LKSTKPLFEISDCDDRFPMCSARKHSQWVFGSLGVGSGQREGGQVSTLADRMVGKLSALTT